MSEQLSSTAPALVRSRRGPFWSVIRRILFWGPVCGAVIAVAMSIVSDPVASVLFPAYLAAGAVVGFLGSIASIVVALSVWFLLQFGRVGVRGRAIAAATGAAIGVPTLWAWALLSLVVADGASANVWMLVAPVAIASIVLAALLCRRFLRTGPHGA